MEDIHRDTFFLAETVARNGGVCTMKERAALLSCYDPYVANKVARKLRRHVREWEEIERRDRELWHNISRTQMVAKQAISRLTKLAQSIQAVSENQVSRAA